MKDVNLSNAIFIIGSVEDAIKCENKIGITVHGFEKEKGLFFLIPTMTKNSVYIEVLQKILPHINFKLLSDLSEHYKEFLKYNILNLKSIEQKKL